MPTDDRGSRILEELARKLDRRVFLDRSLRAGFAIVASMAFGSTQVMHALAVNGNCKPCTYPFSRACGSLGYPCPTSHSCPSGCKYCRKSDGCIGQGCIYNSGHWTVTGCGSCGYGTRQCSDCVCPSSQSCNDDNVCGCRSGCACCNCCSPLDVVNEMRRRQAIDDKAA